MSTKVTTWKMADRMTEIDGLVRGKPSLFRPPPTSSDPHPHGEPLELVFSKTVFRDGIASLEFDFGCPILGDIKDIGTPAIIYKDGKMVAVCCSFVEVGKYFSTHFSCMQQAIKRGGIWKGHVIIRISKEQFISIYNCEIPV